MQKIKLSIYIYTQKIGLIRSGKKNPEQNISAAVYE